ncbi:MAG: BTAD domain-containing putative transcriptional regulator [Nocardioides sp.]
MTIALRLLAEVSYDGTPVTGARSADLLAALAQEPAGMSDARLVEEVWGDHPPAAPAKALQVQVSRVRAQCGSAVIERYDGGYRLGLPDEAVDVWWAGALAHRGRARLGHDVAGALADATTADDLLRATTITDGDGPLAVLRTRTLALWLGVTRTRGLALSRSGRDDEALEPLTEVHRRERDDVEVLVALLRSEAAAVGTPAALDRYDAYRADVADRLGVDPDPDLKRLHRELLATDEPVRSGVRYDADDLLGRSHDLAELRALVRTGRLVSILGPGGLGKTRIAHVLAREASQPRVHFVELVGVSAGDDVVSEVGSALGVRNSVTRRRTLTPAQLADIRARIAQDLDTVPTLLVLDNCEHVLDAVASLVAYLLVTTRDLRVVTTSRAPLGIAAERVFPLSQLAPTDGAELFRRRASAVRPDAELPDDVVDDIVARLDGLPLAVELAAARVRTMSVDEVRRALDDRFTLLRGHDRSAPARHQTLIAVIAWSWDLLSTEEQRALAWLSVFHDGFTLEAATSVLGIAAPDLVEALVDQSLLTVVEHDGSTRHRMLETVREYGVRRLADAGAVDDARAAQTRWAVDVAARVRPEVFGPGQLEAMDLLTEEEGNLTEVLRRLLVAGDAAPAASLLAAQGYLWAMTGNHPRFFAIADLAQQVLVGWDPPADLVQVTLEALSLLLVHVGFVRPDDVDDLAAMMDRLGEPAQPWARVVGGVFASPGASVSDRTAAALALVDDPDPQAALMAWQWASVLAENQGELDDARTFAEKALAAVDDSTTPWQVATLHTQLAMLDLSAGLHRESAGHALIAVPMLERLHADDDATSMRVSIALSALHDGALDEAERLLAKAGEPQPHDVTGALVALAVRAELLHARGHHDAALHIWREAVARMRAVRFPGAETGSQGPWVLVALGTALTAHVRFAETPAQLDATAELATDTLASVAALMDGSEAAIDYPVTGGALAGLAAWQLTTDGGGREAGARLLALAHSFGYNRWFPVLAWEPLASYAEAAAPDRLASWIETYGDRRGRDLRGEVADVLGRLTSSG